LLSPEDDEVSEHFMINSTTGQIYIVNMIDREQREKYVFYVTADNGYGGGDVKSPNAATPTVDEHTAKVTVRLIDV
jgi:hypothetical protein